jgi:hypothetical protein
MSAAYLSRPEGIQGALLADQSLDRLVRADPVSGQRESVSRLVS